MAIKAKKKKKSQRKGMFILGSILLLLCLILIAYFTTIFSRVDMYPDATNQTAKPYEAKISFTFDDGFENNLTKAAPILRKHGLRGVIYVSTGCIEDEGPCRENVGGDKKYLTWEQVKELQDTYAWEVGSHTVNHTLLSSLSDVEKEKELLFSKILLEKNGLRVTNVASPYGDYDYETLALAAKYYSSHRGFQDFLDNSWPLDTTRLQVKQVQGTVQSEEIKKAVDEAIEKKTWLILVFHEVQEDADTRNEAYEYSTVNVDTIAAYVKEKQDAKLITNVTIQEGLKVSEKNLLAGGSFIDKKHSRWTTDYPEFVSHAKQNGSYPTPENSMRFTATNKQTHLYSPTVFVQPENMYTLRAYVNAIERQSGEFGFYVDEYNASGQWISGKWLGSIEEPLVTVFTSKYTPSSKAVHSFKIQTYFSPSAKGSVYVDNYELYSIPKSVKF